MNLISVNVGLPRVVPWKGQIVRTGIFKQAVEGTVKVRRRNLDGDQQADLTVHGGVAKAVYGYPSEHYAFWRRELPEMELPWSAFGENLTTEGLDEKTLCVGDQLRVGSALLMVTQPRLPCYKLAMKFGRDDIIQKFLKSGRSGFYFSVVEEGELSTGVEIERVSEDARRVSIADVMALFLGTSRDSELLARALQVEALPMSWREDLRERSQDQFLAVRRNVKKLF